MKLSSILTLLLLAGMLAGCFLAPRPALTLSETSYVFPDGEDSWTLTVDAVNFVFENAVIRFKVESDSSWATVSPDSGTIVSPDDTKTIRIDIDRDALPAASNSASITISATSLAGTSTATVVITASAAKPAIGVSATSYDFATDVERWTFDVWNAGDAGSALSFWMNWEPSDTWLSCSPAQGYSLNDTDIQTIVVTIDRSGLQAGENNGAVSVQAVDLPTKVIPVTARIAVPHIGTSVDSYIAAEAETQWLLEVWNAGDAGSQLSFEISNGGATWFSLTPVSGSSLSSTDKRTIFVTIILDQLSIGQNVGEITVTATGAPPKIIPFQATGVDSEAEGEA